MKRYLEVCLLCLGFTLVTACSEDSSSGDPDGGEPDAGSDAGGEEEDAGGDEYDYGPFAEQVDEFFGPGPDLETRLEMFDELWEDVADTYGAFVTTDVDWDALREEYRPQVEQAESLGRLFALFSELFMALQDSHTTLTNAEICDSSPSNLATRPPVFFVEDMTSDLGVCATPLADDTLLVYRAMDGNPAGLEPGDLLIGFDGTSWRNLLADVIDWRLPICGHFMPNAESFDHRLMGSMVNNAHLFEEMDVVRYGESETESIPTDDLLGFASTILCAEQLPVDDSIPFPWPDLTDQDLTGDGAVTWGVIPETNIGYIYSYLWMGDAGADFEAAVTDLMGTDGLIIDYRFNLGGSTTNALDALAVLFDEDQIDVYNAWIRDPDSDDYEAMTPTFPGAYDLYADETTFYDGPIALLTSGHAVSAGDGTAYMTSLHPNIRRFGRPTAGAFGFAGDHWNPDPYAGLFTTRITPGVLSDAAGDYLHAADQTIDDPVWFTPEDVHNGTDSVVQAALTWIESELE